MLEFALALQTLTEAHHKWELPQPTPVTVHQVVRPDRQLSAQDEKAFQLGCKRISKHHIVIDLSKIGLETTK